MEYLLFLAVLLLAAVVILWRCAAARAKTWEQRHTALFVGDDAYRQELLASNRQLNDRNSELQHNLANARMSNAETERLAKIGQNREAAYAKTKAKRQAAASVPKVAKAATKRK